MAAKILLVEDTPVIQVMVASILGKTYDLSKASTLVEARRRLIESTPDLIILDAGLPDGDGFSFCSQLRKDPKHKSIPILILTGRVEEEEKEFAMKLGAADYMTKPFDPQQLIEHVQKLLSK